VDLPTLGRPQMAKTGSAGPVAVRAVDFQEILGNG